MRRNLSALLCLGLMVVSAALPGCGKGDAKDGGAASSSADAKSPSSREIEAGVKDAIEGGSDKKIRVVSVTKTDGKANDMVGLYIAYIVVELEAVDDIHWDIAKRTKDRSGSIKSGREDYNDLVKKGEKLKLKGIFRMSKRESGWKEEGSGGPALWPAL